LTEKLTGSLWGNCTAWKLEATSCTVPTVSHWFLTPSLCLSLHTLFQSLPSSVCLHLCICVSYAILIKKSPTWSFACVPNLASMRLSRGLLIGMDKETWRQRWRQKEEGRDGNREVVDRYRDMDWEFNVIQCVPNQTCMNVFVFFLTQCPDLEIVMFGFSLALFFLCSFLSIFVHSPFFVWFCFSLALLRLNVLFCYTPVNSIYSIVRTSGI
jgi:hypothetical protein